MAVYPDYANCAFPSPYDVPQVDPYFNANQTQVRSQQQGAESWAKLQQQKIGQLGVGGGILSGHSNMSGTAAGIGRSQNESLQDVSIKVAMQAGQIVGMLRDLHMRLFEPTVVNASAAEADTKDRPNTVEGNLNETSVTLTAALVVLQTLSAKIGDR